MPGDDREAGLEDESAATSESSDDIDGETVDLREEDLAAADEPAVAPKRARAPSVPPPVPGARRSRARTSGIPAPLPAPDLSFESPDVLAQTLKTGPPPVEERLLLLEERSRAAEEVDDQKRVALYCYEAGEILRREVGDSAQAARAFGRALKADPAFRANLWAVRQVFAERGLWDNFTRLCEAEAELERRPSEAAQLYVDQGRVFETQLMNPGEARASFERALARDPACLPALYGIERLALADRDAALLARAWRGLVDHAETAQGKQALLIDLAGVLARELGDLERAMMTLREATGLGPVPMEVERDREVLALKLKDGKEAMAALESQIALCENPRDAALLRRRVGRIAEVLLADNHRAWNEYAKALEVGGGDEVGLFDLAELADKNSRYTELAELTAAWAAREADPERALDISLRRVRALMRSGNVEDAARLLDKLAESAPVYLPVLTLREQVAHLRRDDRQLASVWFALGDALEKGTLFSANGIDPDAESDPAGALRHYLAAGDLYDNLGDHARAEQSFRAACRVAPEEKEARFALASFLVRQNQFGEAFDVLQPVESGSDNPERRVALCMLAGDQRRLIEALSDWTQAAPADPDPLHWRDAVAHHSDNQVVRAEILLRLADLTTDTDERARFLSESARLWDRELGQPERAIELYRRVYELWPDSQLTRAALISLFTRTSAWRDLLSLLGDSAGRANVAERAICAEVLSSELDRNWDATLIWLELAEKRPDDSGVRERLISGLRREVWSSGRPDAMAMLADALEGAPAREKGQLAAERGVLCERSGDHGRALGLYREAAKEGSRWAAWSLLRAAAGERDADACARSLDALRAGVSEPLGQKMAEEAGWLHLLERGDTAAAQHAFAGAAPVGSAVNLGRALVAIANQRSADAISALRAVGRDSRDVRFGAAALTRAAFYANTMGDQASAEACLCDAAEKQPENHEIAIFVTDWLAETVHRSAPAPEARTYRIYARACGIRAEAASESPERQRWLLEKGRVLLLSGQAQAAHAVCLELFGLWPDDPAVLTLFRDVCIASGQRRPLAELSLRLGKVAPSAELRAACLREAIHIFDRELDVPERAMAALRLLLELEPMAEEFSRAREILFERDDGGGLFALLSTRLSRVTSPSERSALLVARAQLRRRFGDAIGSDQDLEQAVGTEGGDPAALWELAALAMERDQWGRAIELLQRFVERASGERRIKGAMRLADILESQGDLAGAARVLEKIVDEVPAGDRARLELRAAAYFRRVEGATSLALAAYARAFAADPLSPVAVQAILDMKGARGSELLRDHARALRAAIVAAPSDVSLYTRLLSAETKRESPSVEWIQKALAILGGQTVDPLPPQNPGGVLVGHLDEVELCKLVDHPEVHGAAREIFRVLGPLIADMRMADPARAAARMEKLKRKDAERRYPVAVAAASAFGLADYELYALEASVDKASAVSTLKPTLYLPLDVLEAKTESARYWLGRTLGLARLGVGTACELTTEELAGYVAAAARLAEVVPPAIVEAEGAGRAYECTHRLEQAIGRRDKKALRELGPRFAELSSMGEWRRSVLLSGAQAGLLLSSDVGAALQSVSDTRALLAWLVSESLPHMRDKLSWRAL